MPNKTSIRVERIAYLSRASARKGMRPYAITLPCNTGRIIFVAGLKEDKFKRYIEILSALIVLLNKYVKFELDLKKQTGTDKARYIKFNSAFLLLFEDRKG